MLTPLRLLPRLGLETLEPEVGAGEGGGEGAGEGERSRGHQRGERGGSNLDVVYEL